MSITLDQLLARLEDPGTPVVWLDPALPEWLWEQLPQAAEAQGYHVLQLGQGDAIFDQASLLGAFERLMPGKLAGRRSLAALREALLEAGAGSPKGCLVLFPYPDALRQADEAAFEELIEVFENVDDLRRAEGRAGLKAVVRD